MHNPGGAGYLPRRFGETAGLPTGSGTSQQDARCVFIFVIYIKPLGKIPVARVVRRRFGCRSDGAPHGPSGPRRECAVNSQPRSGGELRRGGFAGPSIEITHGFQKSKGRCNRPLLFWSE